VILAAGEATRMGLAKPALAYGSGTMVGAVVSAAHQVELSPVVVVTGFHQRDVVEAVGDGAVVVHNPNAASGNVSSLVVGLDAIGDADGVVILLADMPEVHPEAIAELAAGVVKSASLGGWVEYTDGRGHPIALTRSTFDDVRSLTGPKALWPFLSSLASDDTFVLHFPTSRPTDVNTLEDYERVAARPRDD
jgi:molybdenum cofactor cytidylyltransferase